MRLKYQAEDGELFDTAQACREYEAGPAIARRRLIHYLNNHDGIYWREPSTEDIVDALLQKYHVTPKDEDDKGQIS